MKLKTTFALALAVACTAPFGRAQVTTKTTLTLQGAKQVIAAAVAEARRVKAPGGAIAVVDDGGNLIAVERLDGTFGAGAMISIGKARTAALFKKPTSFFEEVIKKGRTPMVALSDFTPLQGGVPIDVDGQIVGAVGVSGASSAQQDEELAIAGSKALQGNASTGIAVRYFESTRVAAAFRDGTPLIENGRFKVHASHRDSPGLAEVHARDTDIFYVQDGTATFVTGGTVVEGKQTEPDEVRGTSIANGETVTLSKGDVIVVPVGIPHWFKNVHGPFNYFVVKITE
jgi:glc operon protein GlcG